MDEKPDEEKRLVIWDTYDEPRAYSGARMYSVGSELYIMHTAAMSDEEIDYYRIKSDAARYAEMLKKLRTTGKATLGGDDDDESDLLYLQIEGDAIRLDFRATGFINGSHPSTLTVPLSYFRDLQPAAEPKPASGPL